MHKTYFFEDLGLGMEASYTRIVTGADISAFAEISGDRNPLHLDPDYAAKTMFRERVAHGMLSAGYISAVFGMEMPGPGAIYISQTLNFKAPVRIGDEVIAKVKVIQLFPERRRALFECVCLVGEQQVVTGEAMLLVPARPIDPESRACSTPGPPALARRYGLATDQAALAVTRTRRKRTCSSTS